MNLKCVVLVALSVFLGVQAAPEGRIIGGGSVGYSFTFDCRIVSFNGPIGSEEVGNLFSGFLLTPSRVVTVALAIDGFDNWSIRMGSTRNSTYVTSRNAIIHEGFIREILRHNIGFIDLEEPVKNTLNWLIGEPSGAMRSHGFGRTHLGIISQLQFVETHLVDRDTCVDAFGSDIVNDDVFCVSVHPSGSATHAALCDGDQGGPVTALEPYRLVGITSFWLGQCDTTTAPFGMVKLVNYEAFLRQPPKFVISVA